MIAYFYSIPVTGRESTGRYHTNTTLSNYESSSYSQTRIYPRSVVILNNMTATELRVRDAVCVTENNTTNPENYHYTIYYHPFSYEVIEFY